MPTNFATPPERRDIGHIELTYLDIVEAEALGRGAR